MVLVLSSDSQSVMGHQVILFALRFLIGETDTSDAADEHERADQRHQRIPCPGLAALGERELLNLTLRAPFRISRLRWGKAAGP